MGSPTFDQVLDAARGLEDAAKDIRKLIERTEGHEAEFAKVSLPYAAYVSLVNDCARVLCDWTLSVAMQAMERTRTN